MKDVIKTTEEKGKEHGVERPHQHATACVGGSRAATHHEKRTLFVDKATFDTQWYYIEIKDDRVVRIW